MINTLITEKINGITYKFRRKKNLILDFYTFEKKLI